MPDQTDPTTEQVARCVCRHPYIGTQAAGEPIRCETCRGLATPRPVSLDDQMALAVRAMAHHSGESSRVDRSGWTQAEWIEDAERLMSDLDGSIMSLVNGHVIALLDFWRVRRPLDADTQRPTPSGLSRPEERD